MYKPDYLMMTPGPSIVRQNVMERRAEFFGNPDLDEDFFKFYDKLAEKTAKIFGCKKESMIFMSGEGMVGLDSACASLTEPGDRVLVIENGLFGAGFADMVKSYGGETVTLSFDTKRKIDIEKVKEFLEKDSNFKFATVVHCDTPTGVLNDVKEICRLLKSKGILTVVDTVAAIGGEHFNAEEFGADIALGGSQKCFSAPPGITMLSVSDDAWEAIKNRKTPIASFYCNLSYWENCVEKKLFPYTMPSSDLMGFDTAVDNILEEGIENLVERHNKTAEYCREGIKKLGLKLYLEDDFASTVTAFYVPDGFTVNGFIKKLKDEYKIFIGGSYGPYADKVLRIGHMGESAKIEYIEKTLTAIKNILGK